MYSSSSVSKRLVSVSFLAVVAIQLLYIRSVLSLNQTNAYLNHICIKEQGTYKSGSPYEKNLNSLIRTISTLNLNFGFVHSSNGDAPNSVFIKLQCRGDSYFSKCRSCLATANSEVKSFQYFNYLSHIYINLRAHTDTRRYLFSDPDTLMGWYS